MSLGKRRNNDYWGLVKQIGPYPQTKQDLLNTSSALGTGTTSMGKGGTLHSGHGSYKAEIRPYQISGHLPTVKMSKWAQRSVVNKPFDVNLRKPVPGKKFGSLPSLLKGIAQTLNGLAGRGVAQGTVSSTPAEIATNILNQETQTDIPELMVATPTTASQGLPDVVQIPASIFGTQTEQVGTESGMQTDQRPAGVFNGSQTEIDATAMAEAERRFMEVDLQRAAYLEERIVLENRLREALERINTQIPQLEEYRDLAETEIQNLRNEIARPSYRPPTSSIGGQASVDVTDAAVQATTFKRSRSESLDDRPTRRRNIGDVIKTADRQTSAGGSFVNAPGQMLKREGAANRRKGANRNTINTQTPGAIGVKLGATTRSSTR